MDGDDLYAVLEVPRTASVDEIRRAYKRLALRWHPDKNPDARDEAERRFKAISRAYEVLSNEQARATYDRYGMAGVEGHAADESERCGSGASAPFTGRRTSPQATFVFQPFVFADPFELFDQLFADAFALDEELAPFFFSQPRLRRAASARVVRDPLSLLLDPSTGGSVFTSFTSSSSTFGGGPGGVSRSVSSTTQIVNGRKVTRTVTRTMQPDGTVHEDVDEKVEDLSGQRGAQGAIEDGTRGYIGGYRPAALTYDNAAQAQQPRSPFTTNATRQTPTFDQYHATPSRTGTTPYHSPLQRNPSGTSAFTAHTASGSAPQSETRPLPRPSFETPLDRHPCSSTLSTGIPAPRRSSSSTRGPATTTQRPAPGVRTGGVTGSWR